MHWTLPDLRALSPAQYEALVAWLTAQQRPVEEPEPWA
jgi:hypothetical protein